MGVLLVFDCIYKPDHIDGCCRYYPKTLSVWKVKILTETFQIEKFKFP